MSLERNPSRDVEGKKERDIPARLNGLKSPVLRDGFEKYRFGQLTEPQSEMILFGPEDTLNKFTFTDLGMIDPQGALPELSPDIGVFAACPEDERRTCINAIKNFTLDPAIEPDYEERGGLYPPDQSILQQIRGVALLRPGESYIKQSNAHFDKSALSQVIAAEVGHRPEAITFDPVETDRKLPEEVVEMIEDAGAVYLKQDKSAKGNRVIRVAKSGNGYTVQDTVGQNDLNDLSSYTLPKPDRYNLNNAIWTAEHEIPIAPTSSGMGWEVRFLPPYGLENAYAKVGSTDSHVNNIAQGGDRANPLHTVRDVIAHHDPDLDEEEVLAKAQAFLATSYDLASKTKGVIDALQVKLAKEIVKPEDFNDPSKYDDVMRQAFKGNFLCVDITGVLGSDTLLQPMIIEAQQEAGMPTAMTKALYPVNRKQTIAKRMLIQSALT